MRRSAWRWWQLPVALMAASCAVSEAGEPTDQQEPPSVVQRGIFTGRILLSGELVAEEGVLLAAPLADLWPLQVRWVVEDGAQVRRGDPLVEFDNSQLVSRLEDLRVRVLEARHALAGRRSEAAAAETETAFELERRRAELEKARIQAQVPADLLAEKEAEQRRVAAEKAALELEEAESKLEAERVAADAEIEIHRLELERASRELAQAETKMALLEVRAPVDGVVLVGEAPRENRPLQAGDTTWPGAAVARLPDLETLIVEARLFDVDDGLLAPGMPVTAWLDAYPEERLEGRVREIESMAKQVSYRSLRRFFRALVDLERIDPQRMRPGMSVKLVVEAPRLADVLLIPRRHVYWDDGRPQAVLAGGRRSPLTLGACNRRECVVESGLEEGDRLGGGG